MHKKMFNLKILTWMVCTIVLVLSIITSGCVENIETSEKKKLVNRAGRLVLIEPDIDKPEKSYICIIDEDGVVYYPCFINEEIISSGIKNQIIEILHDENITELLIKFSAKREKNYDMGNRIGRPIDLTDVEPLSFSVAPSEHGNLNTKDDVYASLKSLV